MRQMPVLAFVSEEAMTTPRVLLGVSEPRRDEVAALLVSLGHEVSLAGDALSLIHI